MANVFDRIRAAVFTEATRPDPYDSHGHARNKAAFALKLEELCNAAHLQTAMTADQLWHHVWRKIRYAGFRAAFVTGEIKRLAPFFDDYRTLTGPEWYFDPGGTAHGAAVQEFLDKTGRFAGISYNKLDRKLKKILKAAEAFQAFPPGTPALVALFGDGYDEPGDDALWRAHERLAALVGDTTALHIMMDIGFDCVKPDIWLVRLMCRLGWIENTLPAASSEADISKKYQQLAIARAVITQARKLAAAMHAWHQQSPLRELDFVMVKYGQNPGEFGIVRSLHNSWLPVQRIMEWNPKPAG